MQWTPQHTSVACFTTKISSSQPKNQVINWLFNEKDNFIPVVGGICRSAGWWKINTVFVNMFDRNKIRPFQDFSGSSSFFTVEHCYEDGSLVFAVLYTPLKNSPLYRVHKRHTPSGQFKFLFFSESTTALGALVEVGKVRIPEASALL